MFETVYQGQPSWYRYYLNSFSKSVAQAVALADEHGYANIWDAAGEFVCKVSVQNGKTLIDYDPVLMARYVDG